MEEQQTNPTKMNIENISKKDYGLFKEIVLDVDTNDLGYAIYITEQNIVGRLDCFIIQTENSGTNILITLEDMPEIKLFNTHNQKLTGQRYLPIRVSAINNDNFLLNYSQEKMLLNNKIRFEIQGPFYTKVKIIMRYE